MNEALIITFYAGARELAVTVVEEFAHISAEITRLRNVLTIPLEDRIEVARWERHPTGWLLRERFEWR